MTKILILMSKTGGGHLSCAKALEAIFAAYDADNFEIEIVDLLMNELPWPIRELPRTYGFLAGRVPDLWRLLWLSSEQNRSGGAMMRRAIKQMGRTVVQFLDRRDVDLIISVHPLIQEIILSAMERLDCHIPYCTVVTDLVTAHSTWFDRRTDRCFVPTIYAAQKARHWGMPGDKLRVVGLPVHPAFAEQPISKTELKKQLGLAPNLPVVLVMGGGDGIGHIDGIVDSLSRALVSNGKVYGQLAVICGRNRRMESYLKGRPWPIPMIVQGFTDKVPNWMFASDCIVTKAGPGTICEALCAELPIVLSGYIPGQEDGNVAFVVQHGAGIYRDDGEQIASIICSWLTANNSDLDSFARCASKISRPSAANDIVHEIVNTFLS